MGIQTQDAISTNLYSTTNNAVNGFVNKSVSLGSKKNIAEFYRNCNIFITGVTGFVGKALMEKLLRNCQVDTIYILIRQKKGVDTKARLEEVLINPVSKLIKKIILGINGRTFLYL